MTKDELVRQAAKCLPSKVTTVKEEKAFIEGFVRGAEWMQWKMRESNEGQALLYAVEKTAERTKREVIEKAADWIEHMVIDYYQGDVTHIFTHEMVSDFRKAMQDESK